MGESAAFSSGLLTRDVDATVVAVGAVEEGRGGGQITGTEAVECGGVAVGQGAVGIGEEKIVGGGEEVLAADHREGGLVDGEIR